ncbi:histidine kinase [Pedobacter aquatilis]|uniref:sensor histidine kinase n=1 Tax=Pedobacter aquatilis TaxID=351343 RepID=UPI0025B4C418|nr:histidine kinase [Pedobacter aquatilis]MDN3585805.1 histidine kinase [Pedobacter aquatilis]
MSENSLYKNPFLWKWVVSNKYHFIFWTVFIFYEIVVVGLYAGKFGAPGSYIFHYIINIGIFYCHANLVLKYGLENLKSAIWKVPLFLILETIAFLLVMYVAYNYVNRFTHIIINKEIEINRTFFLGGLIRALYFIVFGTAYYFLVTFFKERKKTENLEQQKLHNIIQLAKSENAFLRAQIHPHLLFNTLDFIYQNAKDKAPVAAETIVALSEMMRYAADSKYKDEFVLLGDEIEQAENLINLHQLRNNHTLQIRIWYDDEVKSEQIIPMVLTTLVENIFKHGDLSKSEQAGEISIIKKENSLQLKTKNLIKPKLQQDKRSGTGMDNITKRLHYTYGLNANIKSYTDDNEHFNIEVTIKK